MSTDELPCEIYATPLIGHKIARFRLVDGRVCLAPLHQRHPSKGWYAVRDEASCELGDTHQAPNVSCSCGFYAVGEQSELWRLGWDRLEHAVLTVALSGRVVDHQHGVRAQYQDVTLVEVADRCHRCGRPATVIGQRRRGGTIGACCTKCAKALSVTVEELAENLGVTVCWRRSAGDRASRRTQIQVMAVQILPPLAFAILGVVSVSLGGEAVLGMLSGLGAGAWLGPGRVVAERVAEKAELTRTETRRVTATGQGVVLLTTVASWVVTAFFAASSLNL